MNEKELAQERFCAHDAVNLGFSQCKGCKYNEKSLCKLLPIDDAERYSFNEAECPKKEYKA